MENVYLKIPIKKYKNINDLFNEKDPNFSLSYRTGSTISFDELLSLKRFFVVGEPGYGKSRLLKEFSKQNIILGKKVIFLDLKKTSGDIAKFIIENQKTIEIFSDKVHLRKSAFFKTDDFQLKNTAEVLVVLDALDEVAYQHLPTVIDSIKRLILKFEKIGVVVSCRKHYCLKNKELFLDMESDFLELFPFSRDEVKEYLLNNKFSDQEIEAISKTFEVRYRDLVIQTPRYLEMLVENIKEYGVKSVNISRTDLFESFI